jgi:hypothetical protein
VADNRSYMSDPDVSTYDDSFLDSMLDKAKMIKEGLEEPRGIRSGGSASSPSKRQLLTTPHPVEEQKYSEGPLTEKQFRAPNQEMDQLATTVRARIKPGEVSGIVDRWSKSPTEVFAGTIAPGQSKGVGFRRLSDTETVSNVLPGSMADIESRGQLRSALDAEYGPTDYAAEDASRTGARLANKLETQHDEDRALNVQGERMELEKKHNALLDFARDQATESKAWDSYEQKLKNYEEQWKNFQQSGTQPSSKERPTMDRDTYMWMRQQAFRELLAQLQSISPAKVGYGTFGTQIRAPQYPEIQAGPAIAVAP